MTYFQQEIERNDYKLVDRATFERSDLPEGLKERAAAYKGAYVVYDPIDDADGFMIIGDDKDKLARQVYEHLLEDAQG